MDPHWIATAFGAINSIRVLFYLPQIVAVARSTDGARDIALSTWALWALTNALGTAYGAVVARDALLAVSFALSMVACAVTMGLTVVQRWRWARRAAGSAACVTAAGAGPTGMTGMAEHRGSDAARSTHTATPTSGLKVG